MKTMGKEITKKEIQEIERLTGGNNGSSHTFEKYNYHTM
jgi:hypothetical protein